MNAPPDQGGPLEGGRRVPDQAAVRLRNLEAVARLVKDHGPVSRRAIADALQLNKATVSSLVTELIARDLLADGERDPRRGPGRPSTKVCLNGRAQACLVVEILADRVLLSAWTLTLDPLVHRSLDLHPADLGPRATLLRVGAALAAMLSRLNGEGRLVNGLVIALPGLIDAGTGTLVASTPLGWEQVRILEAVRRRRALAGLHVEVARVANLATIAEVRRLPRHENLVCLHGGETGLGAGVVIGGRLVTGSHGRAGELLFPDAAGSPTRVPRGLTEQAARTIVERLDADDPTGRAELDQLTTQLAGRLATLVALLDPSAVVLAGSLAVLGDHLRAALTARTVDLLAPRSTTDLRIQCGSYGTDAAAIGAATLLRDRACSLLTAGAEARSAPEGS